MGPKTALIHIGTPKTGTTSIQNWLAAAQRNGDLGPVCYPLYRNDRNQSRLIACYRPDTVPGWMRSEFPANDDRFRAMQRRYHTFVFDRLRSATSAILSAEALSQFTAVEVQHLRADLESAGFGTFHVVLYIRDPADFYLSLVQERLKSAVAPPLVPNPAEFTYRFREMAETWEGAFPGSLVVRRFLGGPRHDVIDDFAGLLRLHMGLEPPRIPLRLNATLSAEGMRIVQDFRDSAPEEDGAIPEDTLRLVRFLQRSTSRVEQTKPALNMAVAQRIRVRHAADAATITARYAVDLGISQADSRQADPTAGPDVGRACRVDDILASVNPDVVYQLLLLLARTELSRGSWKDAGPLRAAFRAYRRLPPEWRPAGLDGWLRSLPIRRNARLGR